MKKNIVFICIFVLLLTSSCSAKTPSSLEISSDIILEDGQRAVNLYVGMPLYMLCLSRYGGSIDGYWDFINQNPQDWIETIIFDSNGKYIPNPPSNRYMIKSSDLEKLFIPLFEPEIVLNTVIDNEYTIKRIIFANGDSGLSVAAPWTGALVIQYETTCGDYVLFLITHHYDETELSPGDMFLVPYEIVKNKALVVG